MRKKYLVVVATVCLLGMFSGCGGKQMEDTTVTQVVTAMQKQSETQVAATQRQTDNAATEQTTQQTEEETTVEERTTQEPTQVADVEHTQEKETEKSEEEITQRAEVEEPTAQEQIAIAEENDMMLTITVSGTTLQARLEENSSARALFERAQQGAITLSMRDYSNFEKVGSLGFSLPTNDRRYTTKPGDIILYQGNQLTFYYDTNSWNFTKLGEFEGVTQRQLRNIFGDGDITAVITAE